MNKADVDDSRMMMRLGRILKVKAGYNPNSSSIGTDLTPLLFAGGILSLIVPFISLVVARTIKKGAREKTHPGSRHAPR